MFEEFTETENLKQKIFYDTVGYHVEGVSILGFYRFVRLQNKINSLKNYQQSKRKKKFVDTTNYKGGDKKEEKFFLEIVSKIVREDYFHSEKKKFRSQESYKKFKFSLKYFSGHYSRGNLYIETSNKRTGLETYSQYCKFLRKFIPGNSIAYLKRLDLTIDSNVDLSNLANSILFPRCQRYRRYADTAGMEALTTDYKVRIYDKLLEQRIEKIGLKNPNLWRFEVSFTKKILKTITINEIERMQFPSLNSRLDFDIPDYAKYRKYKNRTIVEKLVHRLGLEESLNVLAQGREKNWIRQIKKLRETTCYIKDKKFHDSIEYICKYARETNLDGSEEIDINRITDIKQFLKDSISEKTIEAIEKIKHIFAVEIK